MPQGPPPILRKLYHAGGVSRVTTGSVLVTQPPDSQSGEKFRRLGADLRDLLSRSEFHVSQSPREGLLAEIVLGDCQPRTGSPVIRANYANWHYFVGGNIPPGFGDSSAPNPVTSLLVAGLAVSEVFRHRFQSETPWVPTDGCTGDLRPGAAEDCRLPDELDFGGESIAWIGCGSIAFAAVRALSAVRRIGGTFNLVDPSKLNRSNLRKYVGLDGGAHRRGKAEVLSKKLRSQGIAAKQHSVSVNEFGRRAGFEIPLAICSADTSVARRDLQAKLPRLVLNAWTGGSTDSLFAGSSRHPFDGVGECLNCAYWTDVEGSLNLAELAGQTGTDPRSLFRRRREGEEYPRGRSVGSKDEERFLDGYFNACEGVRLNTGCIQRDFSVPFVAAIGGALLASSIIAEGAGDHRNFQLRESRLRFCMAPEFSGVYVEPARARDACICKDRVYRAEFSKKWPVGPALPPGS